jgi:predicted phage terminase large subunit-like protein
LERTVRDNPLIPHTPTVRQIKFLELECLDALYGGAAGGGKSDALLMGALQFFEVPGYAALIVRRTLADLRLPGGLIDRSLEWFRGTGARWNGQEHRWRLPWGSTLQFGYCDHEGDEGRYFSSEFQYVGIDEAGQLTERQLRFFFSRLRRRVGIPVPLRNRLGTNPGGPGHDFIKRRYVTGPRPFVPAHLSDNPHIDRAEYARSLMELDYVTREQLLRGDWDAAAGGRFLAAWFSTRYGFFGDDAVSLPGGRILPFTDLSPFAVMDPATGRKAAEGKGDYTAVAVFGLVPSSGELIVLDVSRKRLPTNGIVPELARVCVRWRPWWVALEANGFQVFVAEEARNTPGMPPVREIEPEGKSKLVRAQPALVRAERGRVLLPEYAPWLEDFLGELVLFTGDERRDAHDDQVDVLSYAALCLDRYGLVGEEDEPVAGPPRAW